MERQDLRKAGLKITLPRLKVLEILEHSKQRHLSAEDVYKALLEMGEEIGLATVYRVLTQFEGAGLVSRLNIDGGHAVFELEDGEHHDHLFCVKCNRIIEFYDEVIEERQKAIAKANGFEMTDHSLYIYGICNREECKKDK
ncbi:MULTISPECIES: ferric iron uptake transcriptional regulator [Methylophaga]|jgi:Fur family ferric uptake transcriptional regulator|uniref:Ferric uptake regulation protein n=1 Tax=Methylophaga muralis TaxID=291169 RepID=A0A1E3GT10_9GAMM|nr:MULTISPECIES: ferric iron uptake transcriptional regulator [Methylophaga]MDO8826217.1 ferric iron uptake transcriptional regulator [Methylophaga sp.]ODN67190.1 Ferric uptake regulation protein [Methylophaga muralis]